jgi:hypothetical protein
MPACPESDENRVVIELHAGLNERQSIDSPAGVCKFLD